MEAFDFAPEDGHVIHLEEEKNEESLIFHQR